MTDRTKIYILNTVWLDSTTIHGVFSSREKAEEAKEAFGLKYADIDEYELDEI